MPRKKLTRDDVKEQLGKLQLIYKNKNSKNLPLTKEDGIALINIWYKVFEDKTKEQLEDAVDEYIATSPYHDFPVPGEIKQLIKPMSHFTEEELKSFQPEEKTERKLSAEELKRLRRSPIYQTLQNKKAGIQEKKEDLTVEEIERRIKIIKKELGKNPSEKKAKELLQKLQILEKDRWEKLNG